MSVHMVFKMVELLHDIPIAASFEPISNIRLIGVSMHGVRQKQEVEFFSELAFNQFLQFVSNAVLSHPDDD